MNHHEHNHVNTHQHRLRPGRVVFALNKVTWIVLQDGKRGH